MSSQQQRSFEMQRGYFVIQPLTMIRVFLIVVMTGWSFILGLPGDTFALSRAYRLFASFAPEWEWSIFFGAVAALGMLGMAWHPARAVSSHALTMTHVAIALLTVFGADLSTGWWTYGSIAILAAYLVIADRHG